MFPKSKWVVVRADMPALTQTTIPSIEKMLVSSPNWKWSRDKSNYFVKHSNGSKIIFKGENITSDHELNDFLGMECNGNYYVFNKPLAWQAGGYSDVNQRDMYYDHLKDIVYE